MKLFTITAALVILSTLAQARFGQEEKPPAIKKLERFEKSTVGGFLGDISGTCIDSLVAAAPPCSMQDQCDKIIDIAYFMGGARKKRLIKIAQELAVSEKNTPEKGLRSVDCNRLPRHPELNGLFPKQDPSKGPGNKKKPFVPKKFTKIRNFTFKFKGKIISPGRRFQKAGPHKRGVTPKFNGKINKRAPPAPKPSPVLKKIEKIDRKNLSIREKSELTKCENALKNNKKSEEFKSKCKKIIEKLAKKQ
jgi:hypothetical protein